MRINKNLKCDCLFATYLSVALIGYIITPLGIVGMIIISPIISNYDNFIPYDVLPHCSLVNYSVEMYFCTVDESCFCGDYNIYPKCSQQNQTCETINKCYIGNKNPVTRPVICNRQIGYYCYKGVYVLNNGVNFNETILCNVNRNCPMNLVNNLDRCGTIDGVFYYSDPNDSQPLSKNTAIGILLLSIVSTLLGVIILFVTIGFARCGRPSSIV